MHSDRLLGLWKLAVRILDTGLKPTKMDKVKEALNDEGEGKDQRFVTSIATKELRVER